MKTFFTKQQANIHTALMAAFIYIAGVPATAQNGRTPAIEEYTTITYQWDKPYYRDRYVLTYDKDGWRASETIFRSTRSGKTWSSEELLDIGKYSYEFDTQGRVRMKSVTYENEDREPYSYRVMADYSQQPVLYTKYEKRYGHIEKAAEWTCHDNGTVAYLYQADSGYLRESAAYYNDMGGYLGNGYTMWTGAVCDSTMTKGDKSLHYKINPQTGRMLEFSHDDRIEYSWSTYYYDNLRYTWEYDHVGRLVSQTTWGSGDDDSDSGSSASGTRAANSNEWTVKEKITYTYSSDEVYGIGNSWRDVFGMEGPLLSYKIERYGDWGDHTMECYELTYSRDASGKLLSVSNNIVGNRYNWTDQMGYGGNYSVDDSGHITDFHREETYGSDYYGQTIYYTWQGENLTDVTDKDVRQGVDDEGNNYKNEYTQHYHYTHGNGTMTCKYWYNDNADSYTLTTITGQGPDLKITRNGTSGYSYVNGLLLREVQQDDVVVLRPDLGRDLYGFSPLATIMVSAKDRTICMKNGDVGKYTSTNSFGLAYGDKINDAVGIEAFWINITKDDYYSVSRIGEQVYCRDYKGRLVFYLDNGRLIEEYKYDDNEAHSVGPVVAAPTRRAAAQDGAADTEDYYMLITYHYDNSGLCVGTTITTVDEDGKSEESYTYEYDATAVSEILGDSEAVNTRKVVRDGNLHIIRNGHCYSVSGIRLW